MMNVSFNVSPTLSQSGSSTSSISSLSLNYGSYYQEDEHYNEPAHNYYLDRPLQMCAKDSQNNTLQPRSNMKRTMSRRGAIGFLDPAISRSCSGLDAMEVAAFFNDDDSTFASPTSSPRKRTRFTEANEVVSFFTEPYNFVATDNETSSAGVAAVSYSSGNEETSYDDLLQDLTTKQLASFQICNEQFNDYDSSNESKTRMLRKQFCNVTNEHQPAPRRRRTNSWNSSGHGHGSAQQKASTLTHMTYNPNE